MDLFIKLLDVLTDWEVLLVIILIVYRKTIITIIPALLIRLIDRIKSVSVGSANVDFVDYIKIKDNLDKIKDIELRKEVIQTLDTSVVVDSSSVDEGDNDEEEGEEDYIEEQVEEDVEYDDTFENLKKEK